MKTTITEHDRLMLIGLLTLAKSHNNALRDICKAAVAITDERNTSGEIYELGHTYDAVYCDYAVDDLISRLKLSVSDTGKEG